MLKRAWLIRFLALLLAIYVIGACSDANVSHFVVQMPIPQGGLFLGCPDYDEEKKLPELENGSTAEVGANHGSFSVSSVGEVNFSMPIEAPPGRAGMVPATFVNYSSGGAESFLGFGFSLGGLSSITRCPKNLAEDAEIEGVRDDVSDAFCMDGARLVEVAPNEYRTKPDTFAKILANSNANGPQSFTIYAKSGLIYEYASEDSGKVFANKSTVRTWLVSKIKDRYENAILFKYKNDRDPNNFHTLEFAPLSIDYTDHPDAPATRSLQFVYETTAVRELFARGMKLKRSLKLNKIQAYGPNQSLVREYRFSYQISPNTQRLLLSSIQECAADQACKPPMKFSYYHGQGTGFEELLTNLPGPSNDIGSLLTLDATGDGLDDILVSEHDAQMAPGEDKSTWRLLPNKSQELAPAFFNESIAIYEQQHLIDPVTLIAGPPERATPIDYDHNGLMDLLVHDIRGEQNKWGVLVSHGTGPAKYKSTKIQRAFPQGAQPPLYFNAPNASSHLVDLSGDGMPDLVQCKLENFHEWSAHLWTPQGFEANAIAIQTLFQHPCDIQFIPADIDADGQLDILVPKAIPVQGGLQFGTEFDAITFEHLTNSWTRKATGLDIPLPGGRMIFVDANGDGLQDALQSGFQDQQIRIFFNTGDGFDAPVNALANALPGLDQFFGIAAPMDWNSDGRQDLLLAIQSGLPKPEWRILQSNGKVGNGAFDIVDPGIPFEALLSQASVTLASPHGPRVTDVNGDGIQDLILNVEKHLRVYKNTLHSEEDRLHTITDGMNPWDENDPGFMPNVAIEYDHLIDRNITTQGASNIPAERRTYIHKYNIGDTECDYPVRCVLGPRRVVSQYSLYQGGSETHDFQLAYRNARHDRLGRGFLGFGQITTRDLDTKAGTTSYYDNISFDPIQRVFPYARRVKREIHWNPSPSPDSIFEVFPIEIGFASNIFSIIPTNNGESFFVLNALRTERRDQAWSILTDPLQIESFVRTIEANPADTIAESYRYVIDVDDFGNVLKEEARTADQSERTLVEREVENNTQHWLIGLLKKETTCSEANGFEQCQIAQRKYDQRGKLQSEYTADLAESIETQLKLSIKRDDFGNAILTTLTDGFGDSRPSCVTYEAEGIFPWATSNGANLVQYYRYDPGLGVLKTHEDPNGLITKWRVDGFGRTVEEQRPDGTHTSYAITRTKDGGPAQKQWNIKLNTLTPGHQDDSVQLDAIGRVVRAWTQKPQGAGQPAQPRIMQLFEYDSLGQRLIKSSLPAAENTPAANLHYDQYEYDGMGRLIKQIAPWGALTGYRYSGRLIELTAPGGVISFIENDQLGRPLYVAEPIKAGSYSLTSYEYGPFQSLRSVTHPDGSQTIFERDALGRVLQLSDPDRGVSTSQYNGFDELIHSEDALGRTVDLWYDRIGRTIAKSDGDGQTFWNFDQQANGKGRLGEVISPAGHKLSYSYDNLGRLSKTSREIDGEVFSIGLSYDAYSRVHAIQYPNGFGIQREYDPYGHLQHIKKGAETLWQLLGADGAGRTIYEQFGANVTTVREYWQDKNRLKHIHTSTATEVHQELEYAYDDRLNLSFRKDLLQGKTESFVYDQRDRVTDLCLLPSAWMPCWKAFEYDARGNLLFKLDVGPYKYESNRPNTLSEAGGQIFVHDEVGNLRDRPGAHLDYTAFDLPKKVAIPGDELSFDYDGHQQRIRKRSLSKETVYFDQLYERVSDALTGEVQHRYYIYSDEKLVAIHSESNLGANDTRYVHTDHLGSTDVITDSQGQVIERQSFSVFGARRNPQWGAGPLQSGAPETTRGFTGHEGDEELGLINMRGRMMDPHIGRFVTPDPLISNPQLAQGWNPFIYALNSPLSEVDPSGLSVVTAEPEIAKLSAHCQCYEVTVHGAPRAGKEALPKSLIHEQREDQIAPAPVDLGSAGLPSLTSAPDPTSTEIPEAHGADDLGHNAGEAGIGVAEGIGTLLWEAGKSTFLHVASLGLYSSFSMGLEIKRGFSSAWESGDWAGFIDTSILAFNTHFNPLYGIAASGYGSYAAGKAGNWREAFKQGTIATVLTILAVITAGKGLKSLVKKGGAAGLGAAEETGMQGATSLPRSGPVGSSVGAMSRAEQAARKLKLNVNSPTTRQVLNSLDDKVSTFIGRFRKGSIKAELPSEVLEMTVEEALSHSSTTRKLLTDGRFVK